MRYHLRTLLILLAVGPVLGAWGYRAVARHLKRPRVNDAMREALLLMDKRAERFTIVIRPADGSTTRGLEQFDPLHDCPPDKPQTLSSLP